MYFTSVIKTWQPNFVNGVQMGGGGGGGEEFMHLIMKHHTQIRCTIRSEKAAILNAQLMGLII